MKKLIFMAAVVLLFVSVASAAQWEYLNRDKSGTLWEYEPASIIKHGSVVKIWTKQSEHSDEEKRRLFVGSNARENASKLNEFKSHLEVKCAESEFRETSGHAYDRRGVHFLSDNAKSPWQAVIPGTVGEVIKRVACDGYRPKPSTATSELAADIPPPHKSKFTMFTEGNVETIFLDYSEMMRKGDIAGAYYLSKPRDLKAWRQERLKTASSDKARNEINLFDHAVTRVEFRCGEKRYRLGAYFVFDERDNVLSKDLAYTVWQSYDVGSSFEAIAEEACAVPDSAPRKSERPQKKVKKAKKVG